MRAAFYEQNGPAREVLKLGEVDTPRPGPGEVRVKLATSGVNPSDVKARIGSTRKIAYPRVIPHSDGAGEIDMVGDGVSAARSASASGYGTPNGLRAFGTCAEYVTLPSEQAVRLPANTSFEVGACLGIPAMTAYHAVAVAGAAPGMTLLIAGGAGAVGHYAMQFAKAAGATVITTVSSPQKAKLAQSRRRRPYDRLQARECRRARHGAHRQKRRRRGHRIGHRRQRQAHSAGAAPARHWSSSMEPARRKPKFRCFSFCATRSR